MSNQNKPLVTHIYTADPSAHVFDGRIYIYPSHDIPHNGEDNDNGDEYQMEDYHVFSQDYVTSDVVDHGQVLHQDDVPWVSTQMWAPDVFYKDNLYYLVFPARDKQGIFRLGIATSVSPTGPFTPEPNYIPGSFSIDPCAFVDDDGTVYIYFGGLWGGQLEKNQKGKFDPDGKEPTGSEPALFPKCGILNNDNKTFIGSPIDIKILDENGSPLEASDESRRFFEASWMHKYNGKYYFSYSTGTTHFIAYAIGDSPLGPFTYKGHIMDPVLGWTTHHSILEIDGKWYIYYHDCELSGGINHRRNIKYTELHYNSDGTIQTIQP